MEYNKEKNYPLDKQPADTYDDGDIPQVDLPQNLFPKDTPVKAFPEEMPVQNVPNEVREYQVPYKEFTPIYPPTIDGVTDVIPDEVPRRDGPGGDGEEICKI